MRGRLGRLFAFARYRAQARSAVQNGLATSELPYAVTLMEDEISAMLLKEEVFSDYRTGHEAELVCGRSPMKAYAADLISSIGIRQSEETKMLARRG